MVIFDQAWLTHPGGRGSLLPGQRKILSVLSQGYLTTIPGISVGPSPRALSAVDTVEKLRTATGTLTIKRFGRWMPELRQEVAVIKALKE